ncbi:metal-dependent protease molecular chaperone [Salinisphaera sp. T5B8]|uniref:tRNA (adenosine(37)-N6)-threonylcarbamoyltransferase complex dimerization subunit type 1 TsaB n=1 Tax=Salinisphaera sp. T5B8 TaxID=1304154 RepID=UPI00333E4C1F
MKLLALDASTEALSVAVVDSERDYEIEHFEIAPQAHARRLLPLAQELLERAELALADLDGFAFGRGPGAFTGLRIAAGLVQGLAAGVDRPVVPVSTLAALAARCFHHDEKIRHVRVVQDARMGEIYTADYKRGETAAPIVIEEERVIRPEALDTDDAWVRAGNGWGVVASARGVAADTLVALEQWPHALDIARLAWPVLARGDGVAAARALPVYVRDDVARKPGGAR